MLTGLWWAQAAPDTGSLFKHNPHTIQLTPDSSLPGSVQAQERAGVDHLFDRDTTTEYTSYGTSTLELGFEQAFPVQQLKVYGAAPYSVSYTHLTLPTKRIV